MNVFDICSRGKVTAKYGAYKLRSLQVTMLYGDTRDLVEHFEPYGFTSEPHVGAECLAVSLAGDRDHTIVIATPDRRYRPVSLKDGEVVLYDDLGRKVYLSRGGIVVEGVSSPVTVQTSGDVQVTTSSNITVKGAKITLDGEVVVTKNIVAAGEVKDMGGGFSMSGMRSTYNSHRHGDSSTPSPTM